MKLFQDKDDALLLMDTLQVAFRRALRRPCVCVCGARKTRPCCAHLRRGCHYSVVPRKPTTLKTSPPPGQRALSYILLLFHHTSLPTKPEQDGLRC
jgi:hypothetical protein